MASLISFLFMFEFFAAVLTIWTIWKLISWWKNPLNAIPGPVGLPLLGNTLGFLSGKDRVKLAISRAKKYGTLYKEYHVLRGTVVYISDPVLIKKVLVNEPTCFTRTPYPKKMCPLFGNGVFTSLGKDHAMQRKNLNPYFSTVNVQEYLPIFVKKAKELAEFWSQKLVQNENLPLETEMMEKFIHLTLDIIGLAAFGYDFDCVSNGHSEESSSFNKIMCGNFNVLRKSLETLIPFLKWIPSKERDEEDKAEKVCWNLLERIIEQKKSEVNPNSSDAPMKRNLLDKMIELSNSGGSSFTSRDLLHQVFTFMIGGHETTSTALTWMVFLFAEHPEVQEKAKAEIRKVLGNKQDITMSDISELAYLSNCINECLRFYPIGAGFGRLATKECKLGQYTIPANTQLMISLASLHHNEKYWKNPEDFNPSRFDKAGKDDPLFPYYYLPFSRGYRMCIGYRFALMEMKVVLATLLQRFSFKLGKDQSTEVQRHFGFVMKPSPAPVIEIQAA